MKALNRLARAALLASVAGLFASSTSATDNALPNDTAKVLRGAGATFPMPLYRTWIDHYRSVQPDIHINYEGIGSGAGIERFLAGESDFGASDAALSDSELTQIDPATSVVMVPATAGLVVLAYHLPDASGTLNLEREVYNDIFAGRIKTWSDPRIRRSNPGLKLPDLPITTVVRRDSSGTTFVFVNHLAAIDSWWSSGQGPGVSKTVDWPGNAMTASGNEGVAQKIKVTDGAIGYVEYEFAQRLGLPVAHLENRSGQIVSPGAASGQAALNSATDIPNDLRVFIPDPTGPDAYPIASYTWLLLRRHYPDPAMGEAIKAFVAWGLKEGQDLARDMAYIPLPASMIERAEQALSKID